MSSFGPFYRQLREANTARRRKTRTARHLRRRQLRIEALEDRRVLAPVADFTAIPNPAAPNQAITFNGSSSYDTVPERTLVSYDWDFDNNGTTDLTGPTETVTHSYATAGSYTAKLTVTNDMLEQAVKTMTVTIDTPPTVTGTAPSFATSGTLTAGATALVINFSEAVVGGGTAGNYQLQNLGPDNLLGTADDMLLPLSVSYTGSAATLGFTPLPESVYRLTVRDTVTDAVGNRLDGDGNGAAGGDWVGEFAVTPQHVGLFAATPTRLTGAYLDPQSIVAADFSGDGIPDLVTANSGSGDVTLSFADGNGGFIVVGTFPSGGSSPQSVTVGDFNADGKLDLAVALASTNSVGV